MKHLILTLFLLAISQFAIGQTLKKYSGAYQGGKITYTYYENSKGERVKDGKFTFSIGNFAKTKMSGKYKHDIKDGKWTYNIDGSQGKSKIIVHYKNGNMDGPFSYTGKVPGLFLGRDTKKYNLKSNRIVGSINDYYANPYTSYRSRSKITGQFDNNGFPNGEWTTQIESDNLYIITETYIHGALVSITKKNESTGEINKSVVSFHDISPQEFFEAYDSINNKATINGHEYTAEKVNMADMGYCPLPSACESEFIYFLNIDRYDIAFPEEKQAYKGIPYIRIVRSDKNETHYIAAQLEGSDLWSIVDLNTGEVIHKDKFKNKPSAIVNDKFCVRNDIGTFEYFTIDNVVKPINKERYLYATSFTDNNVAIVVPVGKGIKLIDGNCNVIASLNDTITEAKEFSHGYAAVKEKGRYGKWGYINENGEVVINLSYDYAHDFSKDGIAIVEDRMYSVLARPAVQTTQYHAIDTKGNKLFSLDAYEYQAVGKFSDSYLPVHKQNGEIVLLDKTGKEVCSVGHFDEYIYDLESRYFTNGEYHVYKENDLYGLKKMTGEVAIRAKYNGIIPLPFPGYDYYLVQKQDRITTYDGDFPVTVTPDVIGIINSRDETIVPFEYDEHDDGYVIPLINKLGKLVLFSRNGESNPFTLKNSKLEELGHNKYSDVSKWLSTTSIVDNYYDSNKIAASLTESHVFTDTTFFGTHRGMTLGDLESANLLDEFYYVTDYDTMIQATYKGGGDTKYYYFDRNIDSDYGYDGNAKLIAVISGPIYYLTESQPGAEEALAEAFDSLIQKKGFSPVEGQPHWFLSDKGGMAVALSYKDGYVYLHCSYSHYYDIERVSRTEQIAVPSEMSYHDDNYKFEL